MTWDAPEVEPNHDRLGTSKFVDAASEKEAVAKCLERTEQKVLAVWGVSRLSRTGYRVSIDIIRGGKDVRRFPIFFSAGVQIPDSYDVLDSCPEYPVTRVVTDGKGTYLGVELSDPRDAGKYPNDFTLPPQARVQAETA